MNISFIQVETSLSYACGLLVGGLSLSLSDSEDRDSGRGTASGIFPADLILISESTVAAATTRTRDSEGSVTMMIRADSVSDRDLVG